MRALQWCAIPTSRRFFSRLSRRSTNWRARNSDFRISNFPDWPKTVSGTPFDILVDRMQTRKLGNSDMNLTRIGVGAWAIGGSGWAFACGPQDDDDSIAAIHAALDKGINWIDTA